MYSLSWMMGMPITAYTTIESKAPNMQTSLSPLCRFCEEENETFQHLLNECPCFVSYRRDTLLNKPVINTLDWNAKTLLQLPYIHIYMGLRMRTCK